MWRACSTRTTNYRRCNRVHFLSIRTRLAGMAPCPPPSGPSALLLSLIKRDAANLTRRFEFAPRRSLLFWLRFRLFGVGGGRRSLVPGFCIHVSYRMKFWPIFQRSFPVRRFAFDLGGGVVALPDFFDLKWLSQFLSKFS